MDSMSPLTQNQCLWNISVKCGFNMLCNVARPTQHWLRALIEHHIMTLFNHSYVDPALVSQVDSILINDVSLNLFSITFLRWSSICSWRWFRKESLGLPCDILNVGVPYERGYTRWTNALASSRCNRFYLSYMCFIVKCQLSNQFSIQVYRNNLQVVKHIHYTKFDWFTSTRANDPLY